MVKERMLSGKYLLHAHFAADAGRCFNTAKLPITWEL